MSASFTLAKPEHLDRLVALVASFHAETGIEQTDDDRRNGLAPLLEGTPYGVAYLIGPARAPIGYIIITFGWSVEFGGLGAIHLEVERGNAIAQKLYHRAGFRPRENYMFMSRKF